MKKCPQCKTLYADNVLYCLSDGTPLTEEAFSPPSEIDSIEAETVIRHEPIIVDFGANQETPPIYQNAQATENIVIVPAKPNSNAGKYALFLVIGLVIGGGLVLATLLLSKMLYQNGNTNAVQTNRVENPVKTIPSAENKNANAVVETISGKHDKTTAAKDEDFNGRVIVLNARVRSSPNADASVVETLPMNDRLHIGERENPNSPWYRVECEHGTSGWMHGNTIEFTR